MELVIIILITLGVVIYIYTLQAKFGKAPSGKRLERIKKSPQFDKGKFQNQHFTPQLTEGHNFFTILLKFFRKKPGNKPEKKIPSVKNDLKNLDPKKNIVVWFGHSSYFIQIDGVRILVDPVFSGNASPLAGTNKSFEGSDIYTADDIPTLDYLFITHDHYDHLDYETVVELRDKVKHVITSLGVGSHLEFWGYKEDIITELDWFDKVELEKGITVTATPARHFSGRGFIRNNTLWMSMVLETSTKKLYLGGDSGYDTHFKEIGNTYGPFDLAILENGQYDEAWRYIHTLPEEVLKATVDLKAKRLFPVHSSKFRMSNHPWDEPLEKITELNKNYQIPIITPMIGEIIWLDDEGQQFGQWWKDVSENERGERSS